MTEAALAVTQTVGGVANGQAAAFGGVAPVPPVLHTHARLGLSVGVTYAFTQGSGFVGGVGIGIMHDTAEALAPSI